jgi:protein TonB
VKKVAEHPSRSIGFLSRYHDRELAAVEREAFDRHAAACPECTAAAGEYEAVLALYRESRPEPPDRSLARRISRRIDTELRRRPPVRFLALEIDLLWASIAATGLVAAIALFAVLGRRPPAAVPEKESAAAPASPGPQSASPANAPRDSDAAPLRVGGAVSAPVLERRVDPDVPPSARPLLRTSPVVVEAVISAGGDVVSARILRSNPAADRAVLDALRRWKYRPAQLGGKPVAVYLTVTVRGD